MEESTKKPIMIGIAVIILIVAGMLIFKRSGGSGSGVGDLKRGERTVWLKCSDPNCGNVFEADMREYFEWVREKAPPRSFAVPPMTCQECEKDTAVRVLKDEETGEVYLRGESTER